MAQPFEDWYKNMPVITRAYMTGCFMTTMAVYLDIVTPLQLYLNFPLVYNKLELWRLVTNFFFFDYIGFNFVFHMFFLVRHSKLLEESSFRGRTADFFFMYFFGAVLLLILDFFMYTSFPKIIFLAPSLAFMVVYVWSRRNPHVTLNFLGLFNFSAPYLPWVILGFDMLLGQSPVFDLLGVVVGHVYYFLEDVYPQTSGRRPLKTPGIFKAMFDQPPPVVDARPQVRPLYVPPPVNAQQGQPMQQQPPQ